MKIARKKLFAVIASFCLIVTFTAESCGDKLEKAAARAARLSVYAETARGALPLFDAELKLPAEKRTRIESALAKARDLGRELSITLDQIKVKAIDEIAGRAKVAELLRAIGDGIDKLNSEGFFEFPNLKPDIARYARLAILGLRTSLSLLQADLKTD